MHFTPSNARDKDWSVLRHRRVLHYRKLQAAISRFWRYDQCAPYSNISTTCQHLQRDTSCECCSAEQSAIQANSFRRPGQRVVVPQFSHQLELRAFRDTDATMGPTVSGTHAAPRCTSQERAYASIYI